MLTLDNHLTAAENTTVFIDLLGLEPRTITFFQSEGIHTVEDLFELTSEVIDTVVDNARKPGPTPAVAPGDPAVATVPYKGPAKSVHRIKLSIRWLKHLARVGRPCTIDTMTWRLIKAFSDHHDIMRANIKLENSPPPRVDKKCTNLRAFGQHFPEWCASNFGVSGASLWYVIRPKVHYEGLLPDFIEGHPYAVEFGSFQGEMDTLCTHDSAAYATDNATVFTNLEKGLRGSIFYPTIKPQSKRKDGRTAWFNLFSQYLGEDKWRADVRECEDILSNRLWKGNSHVTLEKFVAQNRLAHERLIAAKEYTHCEIPGGRTRCDRLLNNIQSNDPELRAAIAHVRAQTDEDGPLYDFDKCVTLILPHCPVARSRKSGGKHGGGSVNDINGYIGSVDVTSGKGKTGVEFRYHTKAEYAKLPNDQKEELKMFRDARKKLGLSSKLSNKNNSKRKNGGGEGKGNKKLRTMLKGAVSEVLAELSTSTVDRNN